MQLNEQQIEAVNHLDGPCLVTSVPGSGKTTMLVERTIKLIESGIEPNTILSITFTNKAAKEMRDRIFGRLGKNNVKMFVGTFHALCANLLRIFGSKMNYDNSMSILDDSDQKDFISKVIKQLAYSKTKDKIDISSIASHLNRSRELLLTTEEILDDAENVISRSIEEEYLKQLSENNSCDFTGLLYNTVQLLESDESVLKRLQEYFKYIQVDEVQDTNYAQFQMVKLLGGKTANIVLIGDVEQSIYSFRGARYKNILDFIEEYNCRRITLSKNYRSTPEIIKKASNLIKHNTTHLKSDFLTDNSSGDFVHCDSFFDSSYEAQHITCKIKEYVNDFGWDFSDVAVFYRMNKMSLDLQTAMSNAGVPYTVIGGQNFFDRKEVKDCLALLKFATNKKDILAFHRVAEIIRGLGSINIGMIENKSKEHDTTILDICDNIDDHTNRTSVKKGATKIFDTFSKKLDKLNAGDCLSYLVDEFDYMKHLEVFCKKESELLDRKNNVSELIINATEFSKGNKDINAYLQNIALISSSDKDNDENSVILMTLHASKGLEFPIVFMVGVEHGILPHVWPVMGAPSPEAKVEALEEETRLCYVGMTRAKKHLHLLYCKNRKFRDKRGGLQYKPASPSQFLFESGLLKAQDVMIKPGSYYTR